MASDETGTQILDYKRRPHPVFRSCSHNNAAPPLWVAILRPRAPTASLAQHCQKTRGHTPGLHRKKEPRRPHPVFRSCSHNNVAPPLWVAIFRPRAPTASSAQHCQKTRGHTPGRRKKGTLAAKRSTTPVHLKFLGTSGARNFVFHNTRVPGKNGQHPVLFSTQNLTFKPDRAPAMKNRSPVCLKLNLGASSGT